MKSAYLHPRSRPAPRLARSRVGVLVAESDPELREQMEDSLTELGYHVTSVADGNTAIALVNEPSIEIVIVDLLLPGASGYRVIDTFRRVRGDDVRIVLTSAIDSAELQSLAYAEGAYDFVTKPLTPSELTELLAGAVIHKF